MGKMTRRQFLTRVGGCAGYLAASGMFSTLNSGFAWAASSCTNNRKVLVHLFLDGGLDSASLLIPRNVNAYFDKRPNIGIANPIALNANFGLHPALVNVAGMINGGGGAVINKVGYPRPNRSHEESKLIYSRAIRSTGASINTGWAGRFGDTYCVGKNNIASLFSFRGAVEDLRANQFVPTTSGSLQSYGYTNDNVSANDSRFRRYAIRDNRILQPGQNDQQTLVNNSWGVIDNSVATIAQVNSSYTSPITYANDGLSQRFRDAAKLIKHPDANPSVILLSQGGFDTHGDELTSLQNLFTNLDRAVGAFFNDLTNMGRAQDVQLHVYTEFGRNTFENSTEGTDHGHGTCALVLGGTVNAGVHGPAYEENDFANLEFLPSVVDFREILSESIAEHLGVDPTPIFPEAFTRVGLNLIG
ncbi:MAG: DUF1501 domain-containing protein [Deltaproteobacteria bacterium]|nr:DUF1501 domain-containing protein [Deltaproteobacteria bacterium]